mmetsp:Transcript_30374/g.48655  ORF Transcript_30374/g.48655 Transcript_30374/m.48655 type:complete len:163 (+) Transcript_30374:63-551(+)|eukprot:CAMPEP_0115090624 /NCGR_PEP_ID=MMETSP0227-20121206/25549_1 /TAXON_ID=89957 /ORGANISM="Polarella glacialis, Strain CCMP 1383" /LENGTH=162 /DNA_ID=CAMNT_0002481823 /DNA_START=63 /DNA_END=551 /DNA_ORIENTATION=+
MAFRTQTQRAVRVLVCVAAAVALVSVAAPLFTAGFAPVARSPAQVALRASSSGSDRSDEQPSQPFFATARAWGCAAFLALAVMAPAAQAADPIISGNAKGDPNLSFTDLLPNPSGGKSLLDELKDPTFGKVQYTQTSAEKKFFDGREKMPEVQKGESFAKSK